MESSGCESLPVTVEQTGRKRVLPFTVRFVSFRYFNAAGADESGEIGEVHVPETHLIPSAFEAIHGERRELEIFGTDYPTPDGTCIRDYIHVNDLAEDTVLGVEYLENGSSTALNLGTGQGSSGPRSSQRLSGSHRDR